jgi:putative nucleotidyltransferase with HDIG domain
VIEAAQTLAAGDDQAEMLAGLARQLTEFLDATACLVSVVDHERAVLRNRAGYARPPHRWKPTAAEHPIAEYPRTAEVLRTGEPFTCVLGDQDLDPAEGEWLADLGYGSVLMLRLQVDGRPHALIELYDERPRRFSDGEVRLCLALASEGGVMVSRARMSERLEEAYFATLGALAAALEAKDAYTNDHANQIAELAGAVGEVLGMPSTETRMVRLGALLHDIGKIGIPEEILKKPGPLTNAEMSRMQEHPEIGARILHPVPYFADLVPLVRSSHERWDGGGYPDGLTGEDIPLGSRVIAVCDAFHAMTEHRVYRRALSTEQAIAEIELHAGTQFDPDCARALIDVVEAAGGTGRLAGRVVRMAHRPD